MILPGARLHKFEIAMQQTKEDAFGLLYAFAKGEYLSLFTTNIY